MTEIIEIVNEAPIEIIVGQPYIETIETYNGPRGPKGLDGEPGPPGKSGYEIAVDHGYAGTEAEWAALFDLLVDATVTGRSVLLATDAPAARAAIGAGTSNLAIGTTSATAMPGDKSFTAAEVGAAPASHTHTATGISDSTEVGRSVLTASDAPTARTAIGAGTGNGNVVGTGITAIMKMTQAQYDALATKDPSTLYVIEG